MGAVNVHLNLPLISRVDTDIWSHQYHMTKGAVMRELQIQPSAQSYVPCFCLNFMLKPAAHLARKLSQSGTGQSTVFQAFDIILARPLPMCSLKDRAMYPFGEQSP